MADITVKYNGAALTPTPLVNQNIEFVDYNSRWGHVAQIELDGFLTGITSWQMAQSGIAQYFTGQFGSLDVIDGNGTVLYRWKNCIVDEISLPNNHWFVGTGSGPKSMAPYKVRMKSMNVNSGVVDPVNEYNFSHNEDSLVTVTHKISARGVRTNVDGLSNAVAFCQTFKGINPFSSFTPAFIPQGSGILASFSETIDRANSIYSIQEIYKYNTGLITGFIESWTVNRVETAENEYALFDVDWKIQTSPVNNTIDTFENTYINTINPLNKLASLGYPTGNMMQSNFTITRDSGAATIAISTSYVSGHTLSDVAGYFDYVIGVDLDGTIPKEDWRIDGEFVCYGPVQYRRNRLAAFKAASGSNNNAWRAMLTGLIIDSPIFTYHDSSRPFGPYSDLQVTEVTGLGSLKLSLSTSDGGRHALLWNPKYSISVEPSQWQYNLLPSANIEGQYVLQDLQTQTRSKVSIVVEGEARDTEQTFPSLSGLVNTLSNMFITTGYITNESYHTGMLDVQYQRSWLGMDNLSTGIAFTKVGGTQNISNYVRKPGFKFGY